MIRAALRALFPGWWTSAVPHRPRALRIVRVSRVVADLDRAEAFYRDALGFRRLTRGPSDPALVDLLDISPTTATEVVMQLGAEEIALVRFEPPGAPYPPNSRSDDLWFQQLAIVVTDMAAAYDTVIARGPVPISTSGPERLPPQNGEVVAFKFRDPDGHPLELIHFPPGQGRSVWHRHAPGPFIGIDHSAVAVGATSRSRRFYGRLGFRIVSRSLNHGPAQARLDGLPGARVRVTGLRPHLDAGPGLELLGYRPPGRVAPRSPSNTIVTDWLSVLTTDLPVGSFDMLRDPDGHIIHRVGDGSATATARRTVAAQAPTSRDHQPIRSSSGTPRNGPGPRLL